MTLDEALAENAILKANLESLSFQLEQLKRLVFGHKREQLELPAEQARLPFDDAPAEPIITLPEIHVPAHTRVTNKPKRQVLPDHLPREIEIIDLADDQKPCPCCGGVRHVIGEAVTEKLDYVPAELKVVQTRRPNTPAGPALARSASRLCRPKRSSRASPRRACSPMSWSASSSITCP